MQLVLDINYLICTNKELNRRGREIKCFLLLGVFCDYTKKYVHILICIAELVLEIVLLCVSIQFNPIG